MDTISYRIKIPNSIVSKSFRIALEQRGNFFHNIRSAFKQELEVIFEEYGLCADSHTDLGSINFLKNKNFFEEKNIVKHTGYKKDISVEVDAKFCARYGHDDYSLKAINYTDGEICNFPSLLAVKEIINFSLGNILVFVKNKNYEISLDLEEGLNITGYTFDISSKKKKSYVCLLGIHFNSELILPIFKDFLIDCVHPE
ncbi:hypothetical protein [Methylicorpusculum sp.]|uniref:hypothetical protein n=1 Tax=Methylicorpusculum sp. TaxID=2713644 RepID=UPI002717F10C|nr:hypothetical protein [Methylicorpusculum sp.]MDO8845247.1 hypothetical protein [Methylicorpusculum sp.]